MNKHPLSNKCPGASNSMLEIKFMKQELFSKKAKKHSKIKIYI